MFFSLEYHYMLEVRSLYYILFVAEKKNVSLYIASYG